ncbi:MAG TPA: ABC transporter permease [Puia sp.]|jgi:ABC-type antimicrobial peptide transport system permease subunit
MIRNFFKVAYRNLIRSRGFSVINITGLAIGMAATILILLWIQDERSYDEFHANKERIYRVWSRVPSEGKVLTWSSEPEPLARVLEKDLSEVERTVRVKQHYNYLFSVGDKKIIEEGIIVDTGFLQMFSFPMVEGDPSTALNDRHSVVLTETTAKSLFGNEEPLGKTVKIDNKENYIVTGVLKDPPHNTRFEFTYLLPWSVIKYGEGQDLGWGDNSTDTYVLLKPNASYASVAPKIKDLRWKYDEEAKKMKWELFLYPLHRWHLYGSFTNGVEDGGGGIIFIKLFAIIAGFILLIACINFMNLSTARSEKRAREVGIRKVVGARKSSLVIQFIGESVFLVLLAGIIALFLVQVSLPAYNQLVDKKLFIDFEDIRTWMALLGFVLFTGLLAGSYPAFFLSSFRPVKVLKGTEGYRWFRTRTSVSKQLGRSSFRKAHALVSPRKALVVLQFSFAIILIICTIIVRQQIDYASERATGYNKNNLIYQSMTGDISKNYALIKNELLASGVASSVTKTNSPITERWSDGWGQNWEGKDPNDRTSFDRYLADEGLGTTVGLQFMEGRDFNLNKYPTDSTGLIINESALKVMKFKNPLGKTVDDLGVKWHIVGVVRDIILTNPYEPMRPLMICGAKSKFMTFGTVMIKLADNNSMTSKLKRTEAIFRKYNPDYPFDPKFVDEQYAKKFQDEKLQGILAALFSGLTIFISCLGLFGLAAYMAESRIKEIGVRKVLGASVAGITTLLSRDFVKLVVVSFFLAAPLAWWVMSKWLESYTYRVDINWWVFALAGFLSVMIALVTVSYQSIRAAIANPIKSLRTE